MTNSQDLLPKNKKAGLNHPTFRKAFYFDILTCLNTKLLADFIKLLE